MKPKSKLRFSAVAFAMTSAAYAQVVNINNQAFHYGTLLTDNFNTPSYNWWEFNNTISADQGGTLAALAYSTSNGDGYTAQHSNGGRMLLTSNGWGGYGAMASPNRNFATDANLTNKPLEIQFDMWAVDGDASNWIGFGLGSGQGSLFFEGAYGFLARVQDGVHNFKLVISDSAGTGSGFNGLTDGAKIDFYTDNVFQGTITKTLGTSDGYITFRTIPAAWAGWTIGHVDNLKVTNGQYSNPLATSAELNLTNNGSISFGDVTQAVTKLDGTAGTSVKLLNSSLTVNGSVNSAFAGVISGNGGSLVKSGSGTLTLSGANTYTAGTTVTGRTLELSGANNGNAIICGSLNVQPGATVNLTSDDGTGLGWINGNKVTTLTINGGTVSSNGVMHVWNFPGGVNMTGGTLQSNGGISNVNGSQLEWNNANVTTYASADTATIGGRIRMRADGGAPGITFTVADGDAATDLLVSAAITEASSGRSIIKNGPGTMAFSGANNYTGSTTVNEGTLALSNPVLDDIAPVVIGSSGKVALNFNGTDAVGSLDIDGSGPLPAGVYNASTHPLFITGTGSLLVAGTNGAWTSLSDGNWSMASNWDGNAIATGYDATATFNAATGVTVSVDSNRKIGNLAFDVSDYTIAGPGSLILDATATPTIGITSGRIATIGADLLGNHGLEKTGDGKLVLTGMKSYTGGTTVSAGTLELSGATGGNAQIHGSVAVNPGTTLSFTNGDGTGFGYFNNPVTSILVDGGTINAVSGTHLGFGPFMTMTMDNGAALSGAWQWNGDSLLAFASYGNTTNTINGTLVLRGDAGARHTFFVDDGTSATDLQINANLSDQWPEIWWVPASGLTKNGPGTLVLNGTNTFDGNTVINGGTLSVSSFSSLRFRPTTNGSTNSVSGTSSAMLSFQGTVSLDLTAASASIGNTWNLFNLTSFSGPTPVLNPAAVTTTTLGSFNSVTPGVWELPVTGAKWVFTEADGNLTYTIIATDFDNWKSANSVTGGPNDDDDHDGLTNHQEYAFGLIPGSGASVNPIAIPFDNSSGTFSYTRRNPSLTNLGYTVWYSTDLSSWSPDNGAQQTVTGTSGDVQTVRVTLTNSLLTNPKLFVQVRAN